MRSARISFGAGVSRRDKMETFLDSVEGLAPHGRQMDNETFWEYAKVLGTPFKGAFVYRVYDEMRRRTESQDEVY